MRKQKELPSVILYRKNFNRNTFFWKIENPFYINSEMGKKIPKVQKETSLSILCILKWIDYSKGIIINLINLSYNRTDSTFLFYKIVLRKTKTVFKEEGTS